MVMFVVVSTLVLLLSVIRDELVVVVVAVDTYELTNKNNKL